MEYSKFLKEEKALLIAPAGYGKTYSLAEAINFSGESNLILTHTHAGVSSITKKLNDLGVDSAKYTVETISSFAQRYVTSFYIGNDIPLQEDAKKYHPFILKKGQEIFSRPLVKKIIANSYSGIFVDEYQDCSKAQHKILAHISEVVPIRAFGDPMQGIFDFNDTLVDFDIELADYTRFPPLSIPYRWLNSARADLGEDLHEIRGQLESRKDVKLNDFPSVEIIIADERDKFDPRTEYSKILRSLQNEESLLFVHPDSKNKKPRLNLAKIFRQMTSIESIDDKDFYDIARLVDSVFEGGNVLEGLRKVAYGLFDKSGLDKWFNEKGFKNKQNLNDKRKVKYILSLIEGFNSKRDFIGLLEHVSGLRDVRKSRPELFRSILKSIEIAEDKNASVYKGMVEQRNLVRRSGRRIVGKHIGTTLLTKGLEFDVVVVLDAQKYDCPKHLYVALTRCCKRLIVVSNNPVLSPYK